MEEKLVFTVVVADDETELLEAVCQMIPWEEIGFKLVGSAGNGLDALQLVEQKQPDLLLTDIHMPFISGVSLAKQVRELHPLTQIAFLSGYDDFEYAQKAIEYNVIRYLLKPIGMKELTEALVQMHKQIQEHYEWILPQEKHPQSRRELVLSLLLDGFSKDRDDEAALKNALIAEEILKAGQNTLSAAVLAIQMRAGEKNKTDVELAHTVDMVFHKYFSSFSVYSAGRILTLIVADDQLQGMDIAMDELIQSVNRVLGLQCSIGVSRTVSKLSRINSACREAVDALRFAGETGIHYYSNLMSSEDSQPLDLAGLPAQLENLLRTGSRSKLEQFLNGLVSRHNKEGKHYHVILQCLATAMRILQCSLPQAQVEAICNRCNLGNLEAVYGGPDFTDNVISLCLVTREHLEQQHLEGVSLQCNQAMEAINRGYMDEDLSLSSVSEQLHVSPNYLSANMKKYVGDTFINLLIKRRMEAAHELLTTRNMKIYEVARMCGYSDQHYFSYCFKKYYGVSPAKIRRSEGESDS